MDDNDKTDIPKKMSMLLENFNERTTESAHLSKKMHESIWWGVDYEGIYEIIR